MVLFVAWRGRLNWPYEGIAFLGVSDFEPTRKTRGPDVVAPKRTPADCHRTLCLR